MSLNHQFIQRAIPRLNTGDKNRRRTGHHVDRKRPAEWTRIGPEVYDMLSQGHRAVSMQMQAAIGQLPDSSQVRSRLGGIAALMTRLLGGGPRTPHHDDQDLSLAQALAAIPGKLHLSPVIEFRVSVMGDCTILYPSHWEHVYRICRESIVNAYRHSGGDKVDAELTYRRSGLRITIGDNGCGFDCEELKGKPNKHSGLDGMRERADRIGARLSIMSGIGLGTEVELFLPAAVSSCRPRAD